MRHGFVIDQNRCIGCHACTVACKEEHNVPLGVNRTWVKYIEKGVFPATRRHFAVLRCNHCDNAPCTEICPTAALYPRPDGIIDFDGSRCIGCKSCMQACPYDALYIDPNSNTAAKCNFCAHRIETKQRPACEVVCPAEAIISGDLDDPESRISTIVATHKVTARKTQKGTRPKLYYVGVEDDLLQPTKMDTRDAHMWSTKYPGEDTFPAHSDGDGPLAAGAREVYDVPHPRPWGSKIAAYLWTKSVAAGVLLVAAILLELGYGDEQQLLNVTSPILALFFTGITTFLLIIDLKRPDRFHYLLIKPNFKSWLVLGGYILIAYGLLAGLWFLRGIAGGAIPPALYMLAAVFAAGAAGYSAFLFAQAKGRDLWQSPMFLWHLLLQAITAGASTLIIVTYAVGEGSETLPTVNIILAGSLILTVVATLGEIALTPISEDVKRAHRLMTHGHLRGKFWGFFITLGIVVPLSLLFVSITRGDPSGALGVAASVLALAGLWVFEDLWVTAGQAVPLS
jgi:Fe-S-cluster-containing dehydrogenase component/formate-dependent nitrite reductase membrane component NrfD